MDPPLRFTVPDGWNGIQELPNYIELQPFTDDSEQLVFLAPSVAYAPCSLTDFETLPTGREDLVAWLKANKGLSVELVGSLKMGNVEAQQLDVGLGDGCPGQSLQRLFLINSDPNGTHGDSRWVVTPGPPAPIFVVSAGARSLIAAVGVSPAKLATFLPDARTVLSTLEVGP